MEYDLSPERRKFFEELLREAEPYTKDDPEWTMWDGNCDLDRLMATLAQKVLEDRTK